MEAGAFLDHRHGAANPSHRLEVAKQDDAVGQISHIDRRLHIADQPVLGDRHEGRRTLPVQKLQQFMHVKNERIFLRHRGLVAVEAVDDDGPDLLGFDDSADPVGELAGRKFGRVDLLEDDIAFVTLGLEIDSHDFHAIEQQSKFLVEDEERSFFAPCDRGHDERHDDERFACAGRSQDQRA